MTIEQEPPVTPKYDDLEYFHNFAYGFYINGDHPFASESSVNNHPYSRARKVIENLPLLDVIQATNYDDKRRILVCVARSFEYYERDLPAATDIEVIRGLCPEVDFEESVTPEEAAQLQQAAELFGVEYAPVNYYYSGVFSKNNPDFAWDEDDDEEDGDNQNAE